MSSFSTPTTKDVIAIKDASSSHEESNLDIEKRDCQPSTCWVLLPPEVLSNIFLMCLSDEINNYSSSTLNRSMPCSISKSVLKVAIRLSLDAPASRCKGELLSCVFDLVSGRVDCTLYSLTFGAQCWNIQGQFNVNLYVVPPWRFVSNHKRISNT